MRRKKMKKEKMLKASKVVEVLDDLFHWYGNCKLITKTEIDSRQRTVCRVALELDLEKEFKAFYKEPITKK
jgi:hypothetical protein